MESDLVYNSNLLRITFCLLPLEEESLLHDTTLQKISKGYPTLCEGSSVIRDIALSVT